MLTYSKIYIMFTLALLRKIEVKRQGQMLKQYEHIMGLSDSKGYMYLNLG